ncbi:hypothetical protein BJ741DRAFT_610608 [Chytriomyces cf. hyalinus JEL632]|nr:hypothetical protein BJ741DRAFT_610608 [Chytriomyces cf. hyalinus JEL632]
MNLPFMFVDDLAPQRSVFMHHARCTRCSTTQSYGVKRIPCCESALCAACFELLRASAVRAQSGNNSCGGGVCPICLKLVPIAALSLVQPENDWDMSCDVVRDCARRVRRKLCAVFSGSKRGKGGSGSEAAERVAGDRPRGCSDEESSCFDKEIFKLKGNLLGQLLGRSCKQRDARQRHRHGHGHGFGDKLNSHEDDVPLLLR